MKTVLSVLFCISMYFTIDAQTEIHSGIIHLATTNEETNLLKIHCDALSNTSTSKLLLTEFEKYPESILSFQIQDQDKKIFIKYTNAIDANMILGILERVGIQAYYLNTANEAIYYTKTGTENFRR